MIILIFIVSLILYSIESKRKGMIPELSSKITRYDTDSTCLLEHKNELELETKLEDNLILDQYLLSDNSNNLEDVLNEINLEVATNEDCFDTLNNFLEKEFDNFIEENSPNDTNIDLDEEKDIENEKAKICEEQTIIRSDVNYSLLSNQDTFCATDNTTIILDKSSVENTIILNKSDVENTIILNESSVDSKNNEIINESKYLFIIQTSNTTQNAPHKRLKKTSNCFNKMNTKRPTSFMPLSHECIMKHSKAIYDNILKVMFKYIEIEYYSHYFIKFEVIKENIRYFSAFDNTGLDKVKIITSEHELMCKKILTNLHLIYENIKTFDEETLKQFSIKILDHLKSCKIYYTLHNEFISLDPNKRTYLMYAEFMKLYSYFEEIPELIIIGTILPSFYSEEMMNLLLLIKMLLSENSKNFGEIRKFTLFFIMTAIKSSKISTLCVLSDTKFQTECALKHPSIICFLLGAHEKALLRIESKIQHGKLSNCRLSDNEKFHCKIVFLMILYQHLLFLNYHNIDVEEVKLYRGFMEKVICYDNCFVCQYSDFLGLITK